MDRSLPSGVLSIISSMCEAAEYNSLCLSSKMFYNIAKRNRDTVANNSARFWRINENSEAIIYSLLPDGKTKHGLTNYYEKIFGNIKVVLYYFGKQVRSEGYESIDGKNVKLCYTHDHITGKFVTYETLPHVQLKHMECILLENDKKHGIETIFERDDDEKIVRISETLYDNGEQIGMQKTYDFTDGKLLSMYLEDDEGEEFVIYSQVEHNRLLTTFYETIMPLPPTFDWSSVKYYHFSSDTTTGEDPFNDWENYIICLDNNGEFHEVL